MIESILDHRPAHSRHKPGLLELTQPGDDAVVVCAGVVVTVDAMVQGVHWDQRSSAHDVGWKLAAVNASDIAAMGCEPTWALLSLCASRATSQQWIDAFAAGLGQGLGRFGAQLVGGDTTASPGPTMVSLTMAGAGDRPVGRSTGQPDDDLWVTGTLGDAAAGFFDEHELGLEWLRRPDPPVAFGAALGQAGLATAMMDLSDGLGQDLARLCAASGLGASIDPQRLPGSRALAGLDRQLRLARQTAFGDDYQLLFSAARHDRPAVRHLGHQEGVSLTRIGQLQMDPQIQLMGHSWPASSFDHFPPAGRQPPSTGAA